MEGEKTAQLGTATGRAKRRERAQEQGTRKKQENETKTHGKVRFINLMLTLIWIWL